jgi:serine/threonine protein phosphatase 1
MLLAGFEDTSAAMGWLVNGGEATLQSYGVCIAHGLRPGEPMNSTSHLLRHILPEHHLSFFRELRPYHIEGGYLFVHAGIRPGVPLVEQTTQDLFWIREDFIDCDTPLPFVVVHGHTPTEQPELRPNRIGVDTGAFNTGTLSAVVLEGRSRRLLSVSGRTV